MDNNEKTEQLITSIEALTIAVRALEKAIQSGAVAGGAARTKAGEKPGQFFMTGTVKPFRKRWPNDWGWFTIVVRDAAGKDHYMETKSKSIAAVAESVEDCTVMVSYDEKVKSSGEKTYRNLYVQTIELAEGGSAAPQERTEKRSSKPKADDYRADEESGDAPF